MAWDDIFGGAGVMTSGSGGGIDPQGGASGSAGSGGAGGVLIVPDTVIRTDVWGRVTGGVSGQTIQQAAAAAAAAAARQAQIAATADAFASAQQIILASRQAARGAWRDVTGTVDGYEGYEPGIFDRAAFLLSAPLTSLATATEQATARAATALKEVGGPLSVGALVGGSGAILAIGGILVLVLLLKR